MKIEVLKEFIKKTVQQEVKNIVKDELKTQLVEILLGNSIKTTEMKQSFIDKSESMIEESVSIPTQKVKRSIKYTNNPVLNDILNQTSGGIPQEGGVVSMMGGYDTNDQEVITETKTPENAPEPVKTVYSAINRDYRSLMKAVNKKRPILK
jgi:hypothetical protein